MLNTIYPEQEHKIFSGRKYYLNILKNNKEDVKKGIGKNILFLGQRGIGKSTLVKEFIQQTKDMSFAFIDLNKISLSPEKFAVEFIGNFLFWVMKEDITNYTSFTDIKHLMQLNLPRRSKDILKDIKNELEKIKPDQNLVLQRAFSFPAVFGDETNKKIITCIKELQEIEALNKFEQVKNVSALFERNIAGATFISTTSDSKFASKLNEFVTENLSYLDEEETKELAEKITTKKIDLHTLYHTSLGHPYYTKVICNAFSKTNDVRKAFFTELLSKEGKINVKCKELLNYYLNKARGKSLLFILLKVLSESPLRLSETARKIYRSSPVTKSLLSRLIDVDVLQLKNNLFSYNDPILRQYVKNVITNNLEFEGSVPEKILDKIKEEI